MDDLPSTNFMEKVNELKVLPIPEKMIFDMINNISHVIKFKKVIDKAIKPDLAKVKNVKEIFDS